MLSSTVAFYGIFVLSKYCNCRLAINRLRLPIWSQPDNCLLYMTTWLDTAVEGVAFLLEDIRCCCLIHVFLKGPGGVEFSRWCLFRQGCGISLFVHALVDTGVIINKVFRISEFLVVFSPYLLLNSIEAHLRASMAVNCHWSSLSAAVRLLLNMCIWSRRFLPSRLSSLILLLLFYRTRIEVMLMLSLVTSTCRLLLRLISSIEFIILWDTWVLLLDRSRCLCRYAISIQIFFLYCLLSFAGKHLLFYWFNPLDSLFLLFRCTLVPFLRWHQELHLVFPIRRDWLLLLLLQLVESLLEFQVLLLQVCLTFLIFFMSLKLLFDFLKNARKYLITFLTFMLSFYWSSQIFGLMHSSSLWGLCHVLGIPSTVPVVWTRESWLWL